MSNKATALLIVLWLLLVTSLVGNVYFIVYAKASLGEGWFIGEDGEPITYTKPSWVSGVPMNSEYQGRGIYRVEYDSGWAIYVNRKGVVWKAFREPISGSGMGVVGYTMSLSMASLSTILGATVYTKRRRERESFRRFKETLWRIANENKEPGVLDMVQNSKGVWVLENI